MSEQYCDTCGREDRPLTVVGDVYQCDRHVPTPSGGPAPRSTPLSAYRDVIATAITDAGYPDHLDTATISLVEDCLRTNRTGRAALKGQDTKHPIFQERWTRAPSRLCPILVCLV